MILNDITATKQMKKIQVNYNQFIAHASLYINQGCDFIRRENIEGGIKDIFKISVKPSGTTSVRINTSKPKIINHHKIFMCHRFTQPTDYNFTCSSYGPPYTFMYNLKNILIRGKTVRCSIGDSSDDWYVSYINLYNYQNVQVGDEFEIINWNGIDLTLMYGEGNEPETVDEFVRQCDLNGIKLEEKLVYNVDGTLRDWIV